MTSCQELGFHNSYHTFLQIKIHVKRYCLLPQNHRGRAQCLIYALILIHCYRVNVSFTLPCSHSYKKVCATRKKRGPISKIFLSSWSELEQIRSQAINSQSGFETHANWDFTYWSCKPKGQVYFHNFLGRRYILKENKCRQTLKQSFASERKFMHKTHN